VITFERTDGLWTATLARQEKRNAVTGAMLRDLVSFALSASDTARAFVITGEGPVFSAGADLDEVQSGTLATDPMWERLSATIANMPCLTLAALNGTCAGGSLGMVLACDLRLAVPETQLFYPVLKMGVLPQPSDPARLQQLAGPGLARRMLLAGVRIDAQEARTAGLIDEVAAPERLLLRARELVAPALTADPENLIAIKRMLGP
jgi:enoyl-CoA hydratase/carnithine racemase